MRITTVEGKNGAHESSHLCSREGLGSLYLGDKGQQVAPEIIAAHTAWIKGSKEIVGLMLMTMEPEIQRNLENLHAYEMLQELKTLFAQQAEQELLQTTRDFTSANRKGHHLARNVLKMKSYIGQSRALGSS
ncbi:hypothetical protein Tco_0903120 [Tanacetum coccineum]